MGSPKADCIPSVELMYPSVSRLQSLLGRDNLLYLLERLVIPELVNELS